MRLSRTDLVPVLTIVVGGVIGASVSFSLLGSRSNDEAEQMTADARVEILTKLQERAAESRAGLVATFEQLEAQRLLDRDRMERVEEADAREQIEPLETVPYRINFLTSAEMTTAITQLISDRGQVAEAQAANTVIVTDIRRVHDAIGQLIGELDIARTGSSITIRGFSGVEVGDGTLIYVDGTRVEPPR